MWYEQIEEKGSSFTVHGIAIDNYTVADYMTRIEKSDRFKDVRLASVKQHEIKANNLKLKQFEVKFSKKPTEKPVAKGNK